MAGLKKPILLRKERKHILSEEARRTEMKKQSTARLIIAGSADSADMRYVSGFKPVDPVVLLHTGSERHLVVPLLEVGRARAEASGSIIHTPGELGLSPADRYSLGGWVVALAKKTRTKRVRVTALFPLGVARALESAGVRVEIESKRLYPEREIKTQKEIALIAETQRAAVSAVRAAMAEIRRAHVNRRGELISEKKPLTSERLRQHIDVVLLRHECQAQETIVSCGADAAEPHHRGEGPLRAGETIVLDVFPQHRKSGYWGDITRTVIKGPARPELKQMYRTVFRAQAWARKHIRAGVRGDLIHHAMVKQFEAAGYVTEVRKGNPVGFFHGTGHGVGLEIHEEPRLSLSKNRLRAGHVVTVEPGLYYPELGGVRIEDTVVVTTRGANLLCACPYTFEIK